MRTSIKTHTLKLFVAIRSYLCDSCVIWSYIQLFVFWAVLSCAYRSTEEIINQSRVDTRLTREDGHLQHGWWGGSSHTSETNNDYILIVNSPRLLSFTKPSWGLSETRTELRMIYGRVGICISIRVAGRRQYWALFCTDQEQQFVWLL